MSFLEMLIRTEVKLIRFNEVDEEFARDEGEGDLTLQYWQEAHKAYTERHTTFSEDMLFVCERFKVLEKI